ncbi:MAG: hypothetical protein ACXWJW_09895 [Xanthobacteraceae bacterium]
MDFIGSLKGWIGALTELALMLIALAIAMSLLVGGTVPFFGNTTANIISFVDSLSKAGLIALLLILWLFSHRKVS